MNIRFIYPDGSEYQSNKFTVTDSHLDDFFDIYIGSAEEDSELFWNSDIESDDQSIDVNWFDVPTNPDQVISDLARELNVHLDPFNLWKKM